MLITNTLQTCICFQCSLLPRYWKTGAPNIYAWIYLIYENKGTKKNHLYSFINRRVAPRRSYQSITRIQSYSHIIMMAHIIFSLSKGVQTTVRGDRIRPQHCNRTTMARRTTRPSNKMVISPAFQHCHHGKEDNETLQTRWSSAEATVMA